MLVAVSLTHLINLISIVVIIRERTEDLGGRQIVPLRENLFYGHSGLIVVPDDVPNGDARAFNVRASRIEYQHRDVLFNRGNHCSGMQHFGPKIGEFRGFGE